MFETLQVRDGRPVGLGAHLERLRSSLATLYGRLLAGVTRRSVIELLPVREEPIEPARLLAADEVFLSGPVRGIEPVRGFEDTRAWTEGTLTGAVSDHLRRDWEGDT